MKRCYVRFYSFCTEKQLASDVFKFGIFTVNRPEAMLLNEIGADRANSGENWNTRLKS
jgi:hypothetical protein